MNRLIHTLPLLGLLVALCFGVSSNTLHAQSFNSTGLSGENLNNPTSLEFGPDGRLYVSQQNGAIKAYTITQSGSNYNVTATEDIDIIRQVLNHQDFNGQIFPGAISRQITGILTAGTASTPILYVTSSDYRIGGGGGGADLDLDTNSGIIHKLTKTNNGWQRLDLVRGLPRSEENHANNGMQIDGNILFVAQGGHTNAGAPSNNFAFTTEYAYSAAVLTVDLAAIEAMPTKTWGEDGSLYKYDLPTLDDPTRPNTGPNGADVGDPFGGNDGLNQAKITANSPVQIYAPGFRNLYDLVLTESGHLYGWDNGPNGGWGGHPANEGVGTATNNWISGEPGSSGPGPNDAQVNNRDGLHFITGQGYYGGHPNPIRANPSGAGLFTQSGNGGGSAGTWRTSTGGANPLPSDWPPLPLSFANPIEGDYQNPGVDDASVFTVQASTNGMCEYTSSANGGALQGDILAASFNGKLYRVQRNANGTISGSAAVSVLAENFGSTPLDVTAQGDNEIFPGTIWAATYGADNITVFTPTAGPIGGCQNVTSISLDNDNDGYTNADETQNGTDPCSQASTPPDADGTLINGFKVSDLNDPDDDDDGLNDNIDAFALDASNGQNTVLPLDLPLLNGDPGTGFFGVGFTGLMTNGQDYLLNIADETNSSTEIIAGGAVGLFTINNQEGGDAYNEFNSLKNGFQLGFPLTQNSPVTTLETKLLGPIWNGTPINFQQAGFALSDGSQVNYLKLVPISLNGTKVEVQYQEDDADVASQAYTFAGLETASEIVLQLVIDPAAGTVQPKIKLDNGPLQNVGAAVQLQGNLLQRVQGNLAPAVTILTTSAAPGVTMNATYDYIRINQAGSTATGSWTTIDGNGTCNATGQPGSCAQGRHEASYVQVGRKFYLLGGREHGSNVNIYDPATDTWTIGSDPGFPVHHFQAVAFDGLIYAIGIFEDNNFPTEKPYDKVLIYDPARDRWFDGPAIPTARIRGSAGCVARNGKLYLVGGITNGHTSGWSNKFDEYDPATGQWTTLPNVPRARDHFHAALSGDKLYVVGGRRSGQTSTFLPTIGAVDVYDFGTGSWSRLPNNLPTQRAAPAVGILNGELIVVGGERNAGLANDDVEALNLTTNEWRTLAPLNEGRHGTQAIVNNGAIYVASGSPNLGGGSTQTQERFTFNGGNPSVTGTVLAQAQVSSPSGKTWNNVVNGQNANETIMLSHSGGNQGAVIEQMSISGNGFSIVGGANALLGRLIRPSSAIDILVNYARSSNAAASGTLTIRTSASAQNITVALNAPAVGSTGGGDSFFINCAGPAVTTGGQAYIADQYFTASNAFAGNGAAIGGTRQDVLYRGHRFRNGNFGYNIPISNGSYDVTLKFAETFFSTAGNGASGPGGRVFNVNIEGQRVLTNFDVNAASGSNAAVAVDRTFTVNVTGGNLDIDFLKGTANNPFISAITVVPSSGTPSGPSMSLNPTSIAFQTQALNTTSNAVNVTVSNSGDQSATVNSISIAGAQASAFANTNLSGGNTIAAGASRTFQVTFRPTSAQPAVQQAQLTVDFNGSVSSLTMNLTGEAQQPSGGGSGGGNGADLEMSASSTNGTIGQWQVGGGRFTLTNTGTASASGVTVMLRLPSGYVYEGGNEAMVSQGTFNPYQGGEWNVGTLAAGASATIDYRVFNPLTSAAKVDAWVSGQNGTDQDSSPSANPDGEDDTTCFEFNGSGACGANIGGGGGPVVPGPAILSVSPANINFPSRQGGQTATQAVTISNTGGTAATVSRRRFIAPNPGQFAFSGLGASTSIAAGASVTFNLTFAPTLNNSGTKTSTFRIEFADGVSTINIPVSGTISVPTGGGGNDPDLELAITTTTPNPGIWTTFEGTVTITNNGGASVSGVAVQMALPPDMVFVGGNEALTSKGSFNPYSAPQTWMIGTLAAGATATLDANLFYMTTAPRRLTAWVSAQNGADADSQAGNGFGNGEDDEACFEYRGGGACSSSSARVATPTNFFAAIRDLEVETYWNLDQHDLSTRDYVVERSTSDSDWELIGTALPNANPTLHVWDMAPAFGLNRYRLSTRNADGSIREQSIREVSFNVDARVMQVFPNPASDRLTIFTPSSDVYEMEVEIYNALGQQMSSFKFDRAATQEIELGAHWPEGFYQVQVRVGGVRKAFGVQVVR